MTDLFLEADAPPSRPYRCDYCGRTGWTRRRKPRCEGLKDGSRHPQAPMTRVDESDAGQGDELLLR